MKTILSVVAALAAFAVHAYDPAPCTNSFTKEGVSYVQRGALGNWDYVVTNVVRTVFGEAKLLPKYLHYARFYGAYPDDARWYYDLKRGEHSAGHCSARRDGDFLERNYDWYLDSTAEFVTETVGNGEIFSSVAVASVGTNLTEEIVQSGVESRFYRCLQGAALDGLNENGVAAEINVVEGDPMTSGWKNTGDIHPLGAIRFALDYGTNAAQVAHALADRICFPDGWRQNFHYMICDRDETYVVENGVAHKVENSPSRFAVMTNFGLYPSNYGGEGTERYDILGSPSRPIEDAYFTLAYERATTPVRVTDIGLDTNRVFTAWERKDKEGHRDEVTASGEKWWQTVHTSKYDLRNLTLNVAVQESGVYYSFAVPDARLVRSVNGERGNVTVTPEKIGALPDDEGKLVADENFRRAVAEVSPPVELPEKWALANVTNANGQAVSAQDVDALPDNEDELVANDNFKGAVERVSPPVVLPEKWAFANVTNASGQAVAASDVHALPDNATASDVNALPDNEDALVGNQNFSNAVGRVVTIPEPTEPTVTRIYSETELSTNRYVNGDLEIWSYENNFPKITDNCTYIVMESSVPSLMPVGYTFDLKMERYEDYGCITYQGYAYGSVYIGAYFDQYSEDDEPYGHIEMSFDDPDAWDYYTPMTDYMTWDELNANNGLIEMTDPYNGARLLIKNAEVKSGWAKRGEVLSDKSVVKLSNVTNDIQVGKYFPATCDHIDAVDMTKIRSFFGAYTLTSKETASHMAWNVMNGSAFKMLCKNGTIDTQGQTETYYDDDMNGWTYYQVGVIKSNAIEYPVFINVDHPDIGSCLSYDSYYGKFVGVEDNRFSKVGMHFRVTRLNFDFLSIYYGDTLFAYPKRYSGKYQYKSPDSDTWSADIDFSQDEGGVITFTVDNVKYRYVTPGGLYGRKIEFAGKKSNAVSLLENGDGSKKLTVDRDYIEKGGPAPEPRYYGFAGQSNQPVPVVGSYMLYEVERVGDYRKFSTKGPADDGYWYLAMVTNYNGNKLGLYGARTQNTNNVSFTYIYYDSTIEAIAQRTATYKSIGGKYKYWKLCSVQDVAPLDTTNHVALIEDRYGTNGTTYVSGDGDFVTEESGDMMNLCIGETYHDDDCAKLHKVESDNLFEFASTEPWSGNYWKVVCNTWFIGYYLVEVSNSVDNVSWSRHNAINVSAASYEALKRLDNFKVYNAPASPDCMWAKIITSKSVVSRKHLATEEWVRSLIPETPAVSVPMKATSLPDIVIRANALEAELETLKRSIRELEGVTK